MIIENNFKKLDNITLSLQAQIISLTVTESKLASVKFLAELTNLEKLDLSKNEISSMFPLRNMVKLQLLDLS